MDDDSSEDREDLGALDDIAFLGIRREARETACRTPAEELSREARERLDAIEQEFLKRASMAWRDT